MNGGSSSTFPPGPILFPTANIREAFADRIIITLQEPDPTPWIVTETRIQAQNVRSFSILDETIIKNHLAHRALGSMVYDFTDGQFALTNFGSRGLDGVHVELEKAGKFQMNWAPPDPSLIAEKGTLQFEALGRLERSAAVQSLGSVLVTPADVTPFASFFDVFVDLDPLETKEARIVVMESGKLVKSFDLELTREPVARIPFPDGCGKGEWPFPRPLPCYLIDLPGLNPVFIRGLREPIQGDQVLILAPNSISPVDYLTGFNLYAANLRELVLTQEISEPPLRKEHEMDFEYVHRFDINGDSGIATAKGRLDFLTGAVIYDWFVPKYIEGYRRWPVSPVTKVLTSGGPVVALERLDALNLFSLTRGMLGYQVHAQTRDEYAQIDTQIEVTREENTVYAQLHSTGKSSYPEIVSISPKATFRQVPNGNGGFTEMGEKTLFAADGTEITTQVTADFQGPFALNFERAQVREVRMELVEINENATKGRIRLQSLVRPEQAETNRLVKFGLLHTSLGAARLAERGEELLVTNIGSSGQDGVSIDLGLSQYHITQFHPEPPADATLESFLKFDVIGGDTDSNEPFWTLRSEKLGNQFGLSLDVTKVKPEQVYIEWKLKDVVIGRYTLPNLPDLDDIIVNIPVEGCRVDPFWRMDDEFMAIIDFPPGPISIPGLPERELYADSVVISAVNPSLNVRYLSRIQMVGMNVPQVNILDELLGMFHHGHRMLGGGIFHADGHSLTISDATLSPDLVYGVQIELPREGQFQMNWAPIHPSILGDRASLHIEALGRLERSPRIQSLGMIDVKKGKPHPYYPDSFFDVFVDFDTLETKETRLVVLREGREVGRFDLPLTGLPVLRIPAPTGCGKGEWIVPNFPPLPCYVIRLPHDSDILIGGFIQSRLLNSAAGLAALKGDEILILAPNTPSPVDYLTGFHLDVSDIRELTILHEASTPPIRERNVMDFEYVHEVDINGEESVATARGRMDFRTGEIIYDWYISRYINGYKYWPVSWVTLVLTSGSPVVALEELGAVNLFTLTKGELGYTIMTQTRDELASIDTEIQVTRIGNTVRAHLRSQGRADYPEIVDMVPNVSLTQTSNEQGILEETEKTLIAADGRQIKTKVTSQILIGMLISGLQQIREAAAQLESINQEMTEGRIRLQSRIRPLQAPDRLVKFGLEHISNGFAKLVEREDQLLLTNIGSSGNDGVIIQLGEADYHLVQFHPTEPAGGTGGPGFMNIIPMGVVNGATGQAIWRLHSERIGDRFGIALDSRNVRPTTLRAEAWLEDRLIDQVILDTIPLPEDIIVRIPIEGCLVDPIWPMPDEYQVIIDFPVGPVLITNSARGEVQADRIVIAAMKPEVVVGALTQTRLLAANLESVAILNEYLGMFHLPHQALGNTHFRGEAGKLILSNIGKEGREGVRIGLDKKNKFTMNWDPIPQGVPILDASLSFEARGILEGKEEEQSLGNVRVVPGGTAAASFFDVFYDFTPLGSNQARVVIMAEGKEVESIDLPASTQSLIRIPFPDGCGKGQWPLPIPLPCFLIDLPLNSPVLIGENQQRYAGDQVLILATNAASPIRYLTGFQLNVANLPELRINHESTQDRPLDVIRIDDVEPRTARTGEIITIRGSGFGNNPDNLCLIVMNDNLSIPLNVLKVSDTLIQAELGPVPPDVRPGPIMIELGLGTRGFFKPIFEDILVEKPAWAWIPGGPHDTTEFDFTPIYVDPPAQTVWFHSGQPVAGELIVQLAGIWQPGSLVTVTGRVRDHLGNGGSIGVDFTTADRGITFVVPAGSTLIDCAERICDILVCGINQLALQLGSPQLVGLVECIASSNPPGQITVRLREGAIDWGNLTVCVEPSTVAVVDWALY